MPKRSESQREALRAGRAHLVPDPAGGEPRLVYTAKAPPKRRGRRQGSRARSAQGGKGWVYLLHVEETGRYKIGRSVDVEERLKRINDHGNSIGPFNVALLWKRRVANDKAIETALHERYGARRARGEWFDLTEAEVAEIVALSVEDLAALTRS